MLRRFGHLRTVRALPALVVVAIAFLWVLPSFASYREVSRSLQGLDAGLALPLLAVSLANLVAPAGLQRAALPGLRFRDALLVDWSTSAVTNTVPGGSAIAVGLAWSMYRRLRLRTTAIARSIVVTGVWDQIVKLSAPLLAVVWLSTERPIGPGLAQAAVIGSLLFAVVVGLCLVLTVGPRATTALGPVLDRLPLIGTGWSDRLEQLRIDTVSLVRTRWHELTAWTIAGHLTLYVLLLVCLRAVGVSSIELSAAAVFAALAFGRLVTALPITPGGLGVMEVGLTGALAAAGTAPEADLVAAVLIFRFVTFAMPIPLGALSWLVWSAELPTAVGQAVNPASADPAR
ncbi:MAG: lysylphosphatidylglycerol synthase transmembrane domain-containing protein [Actinomycetota bacterium]